MRPGYVAGHAGGAVGRCAPAHRGAGQSARAADGGPVRGGAASGRGQPEFGLADAARTPLVIAMPKPMAQTLGWPSKPIGWSDILALAKDPRGWQRYGKPYGAFKLGKTNPNFSTSGLNATVGAYFAATQRSSD